MQAPASRLRLARGLAIAAVVYAAPAPTAWAQLRDTIPSQAYYSGVDELYRGDFRTAVRTFNRSLNGSVKTISQGGTIRWIDSICYHAMLGETYYHWGQPQQALEQFDFACTLFLQYPRWMLRVQFDPQVVADATLTRVAVPWGGSQRRAAPGRFSTAISVSQGQVDASQQVQQGGVISPAQLWPVNVIEVLRCTTLAIRRRNELLGPLGPHDAISKSLAATLARGGTIPNHWSTAWVDLERALALIGVGDRDQAAQFLDRAMLIGGQFDHPLTCIALLEQGKLALDAGNTSAAANLFAEAGYSAYLFEDTGVVDDAFRWGELARIAANVPGVNPAIQPAALWARREGYSFLGARLSLALAEELMNGGDWKNAGAALAAGAAQLGDARTGILGNVAMFLDAKLQYQQNRGSAATTLANAVAGQRKISHHNFQIALANSMFDAQTLPTRSAPPVYEVLLADPKPADMILRPLESMAVMTTSHGAAFDRWIFAGLERKNLAAVLEITDRAKRRRYHNALPWGGRLAAVRDIAAAPPIALTPAQQQQKNELLVRFPDLAATIADAGKFHDQLDALWRPPLDADAQKKSARLWDEYAAAIDDRERLLELVGLSRAPADLAFPPMLTALDLQAHLQPGQALLVYHDTEDGLIGLLVTAKAATTWNCGPSTRVGGLVSAYLRDLGNSDANRELTAEDLASDEWQKSGAKLFKAMFAGSSIEPSAMQELVVVPDGIAWYVPFEALVAEIDDQAAPLISFAKVRYAPTAGLAFSFDGTWRRVQRTGIVAGEMVPGEKPEQRAEAIAALQSTVPGPLPLALPGPAPSPLVASLLDALIVLDDVDALTPDALAWSPLPIDRTAAQGALDQWMTLPATGPQRILLPGMHTLAERGGKGPRRRGSEGGAPGDELFFASCGLMSAGAETLLLSRWRVGGQSTLDLVREFAQELPHAAAADAWQRSVQLAQETPVDPLTELRVKAGKEPTELTAANPFFWAGYLVVDSGWRPEEPQAAAGEAPAEAAGAVPAPAAKAPAQPAAGAPPADPQPPADATTPAEAAQDEPKQPAATPPPLPSPPAADRKSG